MLPDLSWPNNFHKAEFDCLFIFHPGITVPINGVAYVEMGGGGGRHEGTSWEGEIFLFQKQ